MDKKKSRPDGSQYWRVGAASLPWRIVGPAPQSPPSVEIIAVISCGASLPCGVDDA
jgi:hypothetical protein